MQYAFQRAWPALHHHLDTWYPSRCREGVEEALPTFRKVVGPLLRDSDEGADTMVWLAGADGEPVTTTGQFWLDRRTRSIHKLGATRRTDTPQRRAELWNWCVEQSGADIAPW